MNAPDQSSLIDEPTKSDDRPHMLARVNALAVKMVFPFIAQKDVRYYLCGVNIRPLDDGSVMLVATDGHRYVVVRDSNGFAERELIVRCDKDAMKHCGDPSHTLDVMSDGKVMVNDKVAQQLFVQPGNSLIDGESYPRIENVASVIGYKEGISGAVNPTYIADAMELAEQFGTIRFFTRDADSPLCFVLGGITGLECFGGIMKMRDSFDALPRWFPMRTAPTTLDEV